MGKTQPQHQQQQQTNSTRSAQMASFYDKIERAGVPQRITKKVYIPQDNPRKFERHLERRKPPTDFRFRPSVGNSSLLARRSHTNAAQLASSTSGSLVPTNGNFVDLVTPEPPTHKDPANKIDSGYISGPNNSISPPGIVGCSPVDNHCYTQATGGCIPITTDPTNIPEYRATMEQTTEQLFFQKFVAKNFTYDSRKAREQLKPVMRKALDRMEDRPLVEKLVLHINFKEGTIRGERRRERLRKLPGQRAVDRRCQSWESDSYMTVR
ncbi:hypothetical protein K440DRAFT_165187 [Wilcoxina mikolae CBS 423.85]|nr:hypothetical protein K440DRAFT_165187 [Wilcoxina mikolae CBS 423.85]